MARPAFDSDHPAEVPDAGAVGAADPAEAARDAVVAGIGPKVHQLRQGSGLSLQQLARRADVSAAAIHKVERGDMVPTVTTLLKLAGALDRPVGYFVDGDGDPAPVASLVRADERTVLPSVPGVVRGGVSGPPDRFGIGGAVTEVAPGTEVVPEPRPGEDLVVLLEGALAFSVQDEEHSLTAGDALHYPADRPVRWRNPGDVPARAIWLSTRGT